RRAVDRPRLVRSPWTAGLPVRAGTPRVHLAHPSFDDGFLRSRAARGTEAHRRDCCGLHLAGGHARRAAPAARGARGPVTIPSRQLGLFRLGCWTAWLAAIVHAVAHVLA